jgi:hypothetical protein
MGVSLVYLGKDDDDREMDRMYKAILKKLQDEHIEVEETNTGLKNLPNPAAVIQDEVWFCGHSRFVEANRSVRGIGKRTLGGFPIGEIAIFVKACILRGSAKKFRLICCESAQQQRYIPQSLGQPPEGFRGVLGNELLQPMGSPKFLDQLNAGIDARASHLEGLILALANLWRAGKKSEQPAFEISGLWGAGDITDDDKPITSFLQDGGSLEAVGKMDDSKVSTAQQKKFADLFKNAHCTNKGLPDFFGFKIKKNFLTRWTPT